MTNSASGDISVWYLLIDATELPNLQSCDFHSQHRFDASCKMTYTTFHNQSVLTRLEANMIYELRRRRDVWQDQ